MTYTIRGIPNEMVGKVWRWAEPYIQRALDHTFGELSSDNVMKMCMSQDMQLWMVATDGGRVVGAGSTQLIYYPQMKVCRIVTLAGSEFDAWREMAHDSIEMWAKHMECEAIECYVRKGFMPKLQSMGYKHRYSVAHKAI